MHSLKSIAGIRDELFHNYSLLIHWLYVLLFNVMCCVYICRFRTSIKIPNSSSLVSKILHTSSARWDCILWFRRLHTTTLIRMKHLCLRHVNRGLHNSWKSLALLPLRKYSSRLARHFNFNSIIITLQWVYFNIVRGFGKQHPTWKCTNGTTRTVRLRVCLLYLIIIQKHVSIAWTYYYENGFLIVWINNFK